MQSQNVSLLEMTAWRITWAAFSHRRKRPERSGGLSKITGLLRGPLETRTDVTHVAGAIVHCTSGLFFSTLGLSL